MVWMSSAGVRSRSPATATSVTAAGSSTTAATSVDVPPMSNAMHGPSPPRRASARVAMTPPTGPGAPVVAGTLFAEHTFTRLFATAADRKVTRFAVPGMPAVPDAVYDAPAPTTAMELPAEATAIDAQYHPDPVVTAFGLDHTDSNQHVNSLVYPRLFAEAALRRLAERERPRRVLVRALDIAYRKPSFAGDRVRIHTRLFAIGDQVGAAGFVADVDDPAARPRCCARMLFG